MGRGKCSVVSKHQQQRHLLVRLTVDALAFLCSCRWWRHFWLTCSMYLFKHRLISCCCYCCSGFLCMSMSARHVGWKVSRLSEISTLTYMCVCVCWHHSMCNNFAFMPHAYLWFMCHILSVVPLCFVDICMWLICFFYYCLLTSNQRIN